MACCAVELLGCAAAAGGCLGEHQNRGRWMKAEVVHLSTCLPAYLPGLQLAGRAAGAAGGPVCQHCAAADHRAGGAEVGGLPRNISRLPRWVGEARPGLGRRFNASASEALPYQSTCPASPRVPLPLRTAAAAAVLQLPTYCRQHELSNHQQHQVQQRTGALVLLSATARLQFPNAC